jgi:eukaryotic-like serine/threonine-protein kinase
MIGGSSPARVGRYVVLDRIAAGGMGTVHLARQLGDAGSPRTVAIKLLRPHLAEIPEFVARFLDEARVAARIVHPNVVATIDVVEGEGTVCLVMEYVRGESLSSLAGLAADRDEHVPVPIALRVAVDTLRGLHAAHTATDDAGASLQIVHRDVSPQNVIVGLDGAAHLLDFGIASAANKVQTTREDQLKGKLRYMAPEQIVDREASPRTDVYAASVVLWELLARRRLFEAGNEAALLAKVLEGAVLPPSHFASSLDPALDAVVLRGLARDPAARFPTADEMARALEGAASGASIATAAETSAWVEALAGSRIRAREESAETPASPSGPAGAPPEEPTVTAAAPAPPLSRAASVTTSPVRSPRRRFAAIGVGAVVLLSAAFAMSRLAPRFATAPAATPAGTVVIEPPPPEPTITSAEPPAAAAASPPAVAAPRAHPRAPAVPARPAGTGARVDCSVPYTRDPSGIRRVKRECL